MTRAEHRTWYRLALIRPADAPVLVAAQGAHLGAAVAAAEQHVRGGHVVAAEVAADGAVPLGDSVGKRAVVELGAADVPAFRWPRGVLPSLPHAAALAEARRGWVAHADPARLVLEAMTDAEHLPDLFLGLIERLPAADNLEVRVLDHFEDAGATDVWLTSRVDARRILHFLDDHDVDLLDSGHVEVSIYVRAARATLRLTEHKTVVWIADDRALEGEVTGWLAALAVPRVASLARVSAVPHYHLRAAKGRDRARLGERLFRQRLRRVDTLRPAAAPAAP